MSIFKRFRQSPARKAYILNFIAIAIFALVILGVVLGTVLPNRNKASQSDATDGMESSADWIDYCDGEDYEVENKDIDSFDSSISSMPPRIPMIPHHSSSSDILLDYLITSDIESEASSTSATASEDLDSIDSTQSTEQESPSEGYNNLAEPLLWGLTYSPYNINGSCPDLATVSSQLLKVAQVTGNIRLYSTDCSQLRLIVQAISNANINLKIYAGIWISNGATRMNSDLDEFVSIAKQYGSSLIKGLSVGNEEVSKGMGEPTLIEYINQVRSRLQTEGLGHIPIYTTEQDAHFSSALANVCDVIQVNLQTVFDSTFTSITESVNSVLQRANSVKTNIANGKPVRIGETGWSSAGNIGPSPLTLENEIAYAQKFKCAAADAGYEYFYFEAKNALWKQGEATSEQNFGIFSADFMPKFDFSLLSSC
ncbi:hypothetical protein IWW36_000468 [Coemansia brasiliensis]|uniref:glucan endo-1,3-beta-D-glucosidase n=1 Tax=Coemansia brasiliensis TaxID=2650707 RepID=A0A9W8M1E2_9FUNG|nr:hypothetical protein IWW36_000468 [Coemansia brasiliensis]